MSAQHGSGNWDVKILHLAKFETRQRLYYIAKCVGMTMDRDWGIWNGGFRYRTTALLSGETSCCTLAVLNGLALLER